MIEVQCQCGKALQVPDSVAGRSGTCSACRKKLSFVAPAHVPTPGDFQAKLVVVSGPQRLGDQFLLGGPGPIEIGKLPDKHISLPGVKVSRSHCRLVRGAGGWRVEDQGSTNGVRVGDAKVSGHDLQDGDSVGIGEFELKFMAAEAFARLHPVAPALEPAGAGVQERESTEVGSDDLDGDYLYALTQGEEVEVAPPPVTPVTQLAGAEPPEGDGPKCPSCMKRLPAGAKICVKCGVNVATGRSILTSQDANLDEIYATTERLIGIISWILWIGMCPIASEAFGTAKPYVVRGIAILTTVVSLWFLVVNLTATSIDEAHWDLMLWVGRMPEPMATAAADKVEDEGDEDGESLEEDEESEKEEEEDAELLTVAKYKPSQLITHALLHVGLLHLAGNMLFLVVIGSRVNALIGNLLAGAVYPLLAVGAALIHMSASAQGPIHPCLGASGAIMGLSGMYLVLMPLHKMHMAAWYRLVFVLGFPLRYKLFAVRGFWVVFFYIAFDVVHLVLGAETGTAHWAHLGGFICGIGLALALLMTRLVNARGGDLLTAVLGRRAWALTGKPRG